MAMTNAEKQAAWRDRRQKELDRLRAAQPAAPAPSTPMGLYIDNLTSSEHQHLLKELESIRAKTAKQAQAKLDEMTAAYEAKHGPVDKNSPKMQELDRQRAERLEERARLKAERMPADGEWFVLYFNSLARVFLTTGPRGGKIATDMHGRCTFRFNTVSNRWEANGQRLMTLEEAERELEAIRSKLDEAIRRRAAPSPLADKTVGELRRTRSANHPDKGNPLADHVLYQSAVEELDKRRRTG